MTGPAGAHGEFESLSIHIPDVTHMEFRYMSIVRLAGLTTLNSILTDVRRYIFLPSKNLLL